MGIIRNLLDGSANQSLWGYQDFAAGVITGTSVTLTGNSNGTGAAFSNFMNYASAYRSDTDDYVYTTGFLGMFAGLVAVSSQSGTSITLNKIPASTTPVRIWWLYTGIRPGEGYILPPSNVLDAAATIRLDTLFVSEADIGVLVPSAVLASGNILVGNGSNIATSVVMSGDITINNAGVSAIGAGKVTNAMIAGNIDNSKLSNSSITINGSAISLGGSVTTPTYIAGLGLQLIGNTFSVPTAGISLYQINTIGQYSALANLTDTTANAIATDVVDVVGSGAITVSNGAKSVFGVAGSNLTIGIPLGTNSVNGYLSASDRNLFNNKFGDQANQFTALTAKSTLVDSDVLVVEDSAASAYAKKKTLLSDVWAYTSTKTGTFTNKTLSDSTTFFGNVSDTTKKLIFSLGGATTAKTLTIASAHTLDRTITLPDATCTLVGRDTTDTLTNKSIDAGQVNSGTLSSARIPTTLSDGNYYITSGGLFVTGYTGNSYGYYQYYKYNANGLWSPSVGSISIEATGAVYTTNEFRVSSDIRIKNIIGETDSLNDLEILNKIKITNYTYKDKTRHGSQIYKKVIAQQIKQVVPQAVSEKKEFIPNIMKMATATDNVVHLGNHGLVDGDYVRLIGAGDKFLDAEVCEVAKDSFGIKLDSERRKTLQGGVFVYGVRVDDFLTIDYDALSMLTISALQALNNKFNNLYNDIYRVGI